MAAVVRLRALVLAIIVLGIAAGVALSLTGESRPPAEHVQSSATVLLPTGTPVPPIVPRDIVGSRGPVFAAIAEGTDASDKILVLTIAGASFSRGHVLVWNEDGRLRSQVFASASDGGFLSGNSAVVHAVQQVTSVGRELALVYDATAYGSGSPTAMFVLLRLEGDQWRIVWDSADHIADWRSSHGRVEFPQGDLSELIVRSDSAFVRDDPLSGVIAEANAGPHRYFVDTWVRLGNGYTLASAVTAPSAYATLVQFLYALGTGGDATARALVTDAALVDTARSYGLDGWAGKNWGIACPVGDCGVQAGPIGFDPQRYHGEPNVLVSFTDQNGQWLISDITKTP